MNEVQRLNELASNIQSIIDEKHQYKQFIQKMADKLGLVGEFYQDYGTNQIMKKLEEVLEKAWMYEDTSK